MAQQWFKCKFTKAELDGKTVAFKLPNMNPGRIGNFRVQENVQGELWIEIHAGGVTPQGTIEAFKVAIAQDFIDRIQINSNPKIPSDFIIP
jgi:hypothetical protein